MDTGFTDKPKIKFIFWAPNAPFYIKTVSLRTLVHFEAFYELDGGNSGHHECMLIRNYTNYNKKGVNKGYR